MVDPGVHAPDVLPPGTRIGRYRIDRELGHGGMSVVYQATDLRLGKTWAVKAIRKPPAEETGVLQVRMLTAEADLLKGLDHPALPRIVDILEDGSRLLLIMDHVRGETLAALLAREGVFPERTVLDWMYQLASVLHYLHRQAPPIIYRDMKPANVIRRPDGSLVLLDFGTAAGIGREPSGDGASFGTRGYAAPEQYQGMQADVRTDIYALGMTAAELLTGISPAQDPFRGRYHPFRKLRPGISRKTEEILNRCITETPQERYASCEALMHDLDAVFPRAGAAAHASGTPAVRPGHFLYNLKTHAAFGSTRKRRVVLLLLILLEVFAGVLRGSAAPEAAQAGKTPDLQPAERSGTQTQEPKTPQPEEALLSALEECMRNGQFSKQAEQRFREQYGTLPEGVLQDPVRHGQICFTAGTAYFFCYGGEDGSFRDRVLRAQPFFATALACAETAGQQTPVSRERVQAYVRLCAFFTEYMFDGVGIREPGGGTCTEIMDAVRVCLEEAAFTSAGDGCWLHLTLLQSMEELLREYRQSFADAGIEKETVLDLLERIRSGAAQVHTGRETLAELRKTILQECRNTTEEVHRTYEAMEKWKEVQ